LKFEHSTQDYLKFEHSTQDYLKFENSTQDYLKFEHSTQDYLKFEHSTQDYLKFEHSTQDYLKSEVNFNGELCSFSGDENGIFHIHVYKLGIQLKLMSVGDDMEPQNRQFREAIYHLYME
jgi:hypothetical protein